MTAYEFCTELERRIDYWKVRGRPEHEPVAVFVAPRRRFWGVVPVRPRLLGRALDGGFRYQFTMNQARRLVAALRGED
jgi:hypothetical protein